MRSLFREFVISKRRREDQHDERMILAYTTAALMRQKKLPNVKTLLSRKHTGPQTVGELKSMFYQISARYGLPMRKAKPRGK